MARTIVVSLDGNESTFAFSRLDRKKLYPTKKRIPLDADGEPCQRASLTEDGSMLVTSGMTGQAYFDAGGRWVQSSELVGLDSEGNPVDKQPSTLGVAQALTEVEPDALLDAATTSVYALDPDELDGELQRRLDEGAIFRFAFNVRADYHLETAYLLANDSGTFVLLGDTYDVPWCTIDAPVVTDDDDDDDDELDFEMF
ncbi:MAG: hypothetical protein NXI35_13115 [bacterium]|nr:hypothetical protein [bacterium]